MREAMTKGRSLALDEVPREADSEFSRVELGGARSRPPLYTDSGHAFPAVPIIRGILPRIDVETSKEIIQPQRF